MMLIHINCGRSTWVGWTKKEHGMMMILMAVFFYRSYNVGVRLKKWMIINGVIEFEEYKTILHCGLVYSIWFMKNVVDV